MVCKETLMKYSRNFVIVIGDHLDKVLVVIFVFISPIVGTTFILPTPAAMP